jgi:hypothetical protein
VQGKLRAPVPVFRQSDNASTALARLDGASSVIRGKSQEIIERAM